MLLGGILVVLALCSAMVGMLAVRRLAFCVHWFARDLRCCAQLARFVGWIAGSDGQ